MNKKILKYTAVFLAFVLSATAINVYAADKITSCYETADWSVAGEYPLTPESPEWASMSCHAYHFLSDE